MAIWTENYRGVAYPWHCDSMGHMNTQFYAAMYDSATFHFLSRLSPYTDLEKRQFGWDGCAAAHRVQAGGARRIAHRHPHRLAATG
jgi:acyl-CoA thioester hydrolase